MVQRAIQLGARIAALISCWYASAYLIGSGMTPFELDKWLIGVALTVLAVFLWFRVGWPPRRRPPAEA